jgi:energy-coupling factor transporter ATP-binding protein EcfA2
VASPLIDLRNATVAHAGGLPPVLRDVSLSVERGDWIAVTGDNGSGKTTLLATLGGVLALRAGRLERAPALRTALLLQEPDNQLVASSVERELALSLPRDLDAHARRARMDAAIDRFALGALRDRNPHRLSGGEKQRLALATVWLESPDVLLLDEPLAYLDDEMRDRVIGFVRELNAGGTAVVWAMPGGDDVALARRAVTLEEGRVSDHVPPLASRLPSQDAAATRPAARAVAENAGERVRFESVSFAYDGVTVFDALDLAVAAGECVGIAGRNGSGKSTLLLLAGGALPPATGRVVRDAREHGVLYLPQSPERLFFAETVLEEVAFGLERRGVDRAVAHERARAALAQASLDPGQVFSRSPFEVSAGEMRRVAFAIAFALEPDLLLLDEPASCLDDAGIAVLDDLVRYSGEKGAAVLIASHASPRPGCHRTLNLKKSRSD